MDKLATDGGKPVRENKLLPFQPLIGEEEIEEVNDSLRSGWLTTGPKVKKFEENINNYLGSKNAIAVSSCTAALHLSLDVYGINNGDEVITTPFTFVSTANVIERQGAKTVLADIDKETYNLNPENLTDKINEKTKAIIPVHYAGQPCDMDGITKIAREHDLIVIEDAAHAIGAEYKGKKIGTISDLTCFSFYATKNLSTGEGGLITTEDSEITDKLRKLRLHGMSKDSWKRYSGTGSWYYDVTSAGFKYNMTDIQASIGLHQLDKFEYMQNLREKIAQKYNRAFRDIDEVIVPKVKENVKHAWHLYPVQIRSDMLTIDRDQFIEALDAENIGTSVHFIPIHMHSYYKEKYDFGPEDFPNAKEVFEGEISLPIYPKMEYDDVHDVITAIEKIIENYRM
jgi:dTDP-4-amino-4,6-dideoxygalactose transaminase